MQTVAEVIRSVYNDDTGRIELRTVIKGVQEVNPPEDTLPGTPVENCRWIRQISETFTGRELEVQSTLLSPVTPASTTISIANASRFPNRGEVTINRDGASEEVISYDSRNPDTNTLSGISTPTFSHAVGEIVRPSVDIDFLGTFEVDLQHYPVRYGKAKVTLNGITELREGVDFEVINLFSGDTCTRGLLRFLQAGQPSRFSISDYLEVEYQYFEQSITSVEIYVSFGQTAFVRVFENALYELRFDQLQSPDRTVASRGTITITPPVGSGNLPPTPVKVIIPDTEVPSEVTLAQDISPSDNGGSIKLSSVQELPGNGRFYDAVDDSQNRMVTIGTDQIYYDDVDLVLNKLTNVSGITTTHLNGTPVDYNGAKYIRDVIKDAINITTLRSQLDAVSVDVGGYHLQINTKITERAFNLQPGTYNLSFIGFDDTLQRGLHETVKTVTPFENKSLTFRRYSDLLERQDVAESILGATVARRVELSPGRANVPE